MMGEETKPRGDVATVGIAVDTTAVEAATKALDDLAAAAERAQKAIAAIGAATKVEAAPEPQSSKWMG